MKMAQQHLFALAALVAFCLATSAEEPTPTDRPAAPPVEQTAPKPQPAVDGGPAATEKLAPTSKTDEKERTQPTLAWIDGLAAGKRKSAADNRPMLVRLGAAWCPWCAKLKEELTKPAAQEELKRWILVDVDVDDAPDDARQLTVGPIPALRIMNPRGQTVAKHDGYLSADELVAWLKEHFERAGAAAPEGLADDHEPDETTIARLIAQSAQGDVLSREAALRRLRAHPEVSAGPVAEAFQHGKLAVRLAALELLHDWKAPVDELDPWRPETVTAERLKALSAWAAAGGIQRADSDPPLTPQQRDTALRDIARMIECNDEQALALREQLSRLGQGLLPLIAEQLQTAASDQARSRLLALRYRVVASQGLVLSWPGGLERLAAVQVDARHKAVAELAARATAADEALLVELFKDADPLVRETSLRGLQSVGGAKAGSALVKLLDDPEPNVRAAVLKQMAEQPSPQLVRRVADYARQEKDADLVIHAIRVLKAAKAAQSLDCLVELLKHESWQARAEAAEAVGEIASNLHDESDSARKADVYVALIGLLNDSDPFVVSRALGGLKHADLVVAVEPLAKVVDQHPGLAVEAVRALVEGETMRNKALPHLRKYATHANPGVRAAAIGGLVKAETDGAQDQLLAALADPASVVRQAAAQSLMEMYSAARQHQTGKQSRLAESPGFWSSIQSLFGGKAKAEAAEEEPRDGFEAWLTAYRAGKNRPSWMNAAVDPLRKMLASEEPQERLVAGLALVPLGADDQALPVLKELAKTVPAEQGKAGAVLGWLPREKRREMFQYFIGLKPKVEAIAGIANGLSSASDAQDADLLWDLLSADIVDQQQVSTIYYNLSQLYRTNEAVAARYDSRSRAEPPQAVVAEVKRRAEKGSAPQRTTALALLLALAPADIPDAARPIVDDAHAADDLRRDALQILLLAQPEKEAEETAVKFFTGDNAALRKPALTYLVQGADELRSFREGTFYLSTHRTHVYHSSSDGPLVVAAPRELTADMVRPLLRDSDPEVAAAAGYLLATLGEPEGLEALVNYWRRSGAKNWSAPVYRAIAAVNDQTRAPILAEIYTSLESYDVREFYWTIRAMDGPEILKLRKRIRDEVGMDNLR